jgi:hypothetical protein
MLNNATNRWLTIGLLLAVATYAVAEDLTLTTYYPSPRGVYNELRTAGDVGIGDITNPPGARLHVTQTGAAPAFRVDDQASDPTPFVITEEGRIGVGTSAPSASAVLDLSSTTGGFLPPQMTTAQRDAIAAPAPGLLVFNTGANRLELFRLGVGWGPSPQWLSLPREASNQLCTAAAGSPACPPMAPGSCPGGWTLTQQVNLGCTTVEVLSMLCAYPGIVGPVPDGLEIATRRWVDLCTQ